MEDDEDGSTDKAIKIIFQSTSPVWRTTARDDKRIWHTEFQSTSPVWRTTFLIRSLSRQSVYFNPRPPCGGRLHNKSWVDQQGQISIHVPRVEDDMPSMRIIDWKERFQSTSPVWRTTPFAVQRAPAKWNFNPRPPCGGRPNVHGWRGQRQRFQSTSPVWRTTGRYYDTWDSGGISIHVPRVEDDSEVEKMKNPTKISIHVPRVEDDLVFPHLCIFPEPFQSTSPVWRTTPSL